MDVLTTVLKKEEKTWHISTFMEFPSNELDRRRLKMLNYIIAQELYEKEEVSVLS